MQFPPSSPVFSLLVVLFVELCFDPLQIFSLKGLLEVVGNECERDAVNSNRNNDVGLPFARFDKLQVHRSNGGVILGNDLFQGASSVGAVACDAPYQANIVSGVDENFNVNQRSETGVGEDKNSFDEDDSFGIGAC